MSVCIAEFDKSAKNSMKQRPLSKRRSRRCIHVHMYTTEEIDLLALWV